MKEVPGLDSLALTIAIWAVGEAMGPLLGTLALIAFGWFFGCIVGVWRMRFQEGDVHRRVKTIWFVAVTMGVTMGTAAMVANFMGHWLRIAPMGLVFFTAFGIPAVGMNWIDLAKWAWGLFRRRQEAKVGRD